MKPERTLVLMIDDAEARFLVHDGPGKGFRGLASLRQDQFGDMQEGYDDHPGRQSGGFGGMARHGFNAEETVEDLNRTRFADHALAALDAAWAKANADRLVIAAAPKMLGVIRKGLRGAPAAALAADLAKDLMKIPVNDLPKHFADVIKL